MADQRYIEFIEIIIERTKSKQLNWYYLDSNEELYTGMGWTKTITEYGVFPFNNKEKIVTDFNQEDSFYTRLGEMYITLYVWRDQPAKLFIVPNTYKKVITLTPDEYGEYITRLLNLVQSQFPNAEIFIDDFLKKANAKKSD